MPSNVLNYQTGDFSAPVPKFLHRGVLILSAIPAPVGVGILVAYLVTRDEKWQVTGFFWLMVGAVTLLLVFSLNAAIWFLLRSNPPNRAKAKRDCTWSIRIILLSIPLAILCAVVGLAVPHLKWVTVSVANGTSMHVRKVEVITPSDSLTLTNLKPHGGGAATAHTRGGTWELAIAFEEVDGTVRDVRSRRDINQDEVDIGTVSIEIRGSGSDQP